MDGNAKKMEMTTLAGLLCLAAAACTGQEPLAFCSETRPCPEGWVCNLSINTCVRSLDVGTGVDLEVDQSHDTSRPDSGVDATPGADLPADVTPVDSAVDSSPDSSPDAPLPDMGPPPDMAKKALGAPCAAAGECGSGLCQDSVCCDAACAGDCQSCALPGKTGTCSPKAKGAACASPSSCINTATSAEVTTRQCDGTSGTCQVTKSTCTPYKCTSTGAPKCLTSCSAHNQCLADICDGVYKPGTCPKLSDVCHLDASAAKGGNGSKTQPYLLFADCGAKTTYRAVAPGTYFERVVVAGGDTTVIIAKSAPVSVSKGDQPTVKLRGPSGKEPLVVLTKGEAVVSGVEFSSIHKNNKELVYMFGAKVGLHGCLLDATRASGTAKAGVIAKGSSKLTMTDCKITNTSGYGLSLVDSDAVLKMVDVTNNGNNGVMLQSSTGGNKLALEQVTSSNNKGNGVVVVGGVLEADRLVTAGNTGTGIGVALVDAKGSSVSNLLSVYNSTIGIQSVDKVSTANIKITNATVAFNSGKEVYVPTASKNTLAFRNSIIWDTSGTVNDGGHYTYCDVASYLVPGTGNKSQDPKFVDPGKTKQDFRLKAGSPCVDAGDPKPAWVTAKDLDGNPRQKGVLDIGAYERQ